MARKKKHEEHVNHERWLVSYADFITLLFAFFVTLYAISQVDAKKLGKLMESMQAAFDTKAFDPGSPKLSLSDGRSKGVQQQTLVEPISPAVTATPAMQAIEARIRAKLPRQTAGGIVRFHQEKRGLVISLTEAGFFEPGQSELRDSSLAVLDAVAEALRTVPFQLRIEGHTDNVPIKTARFPSNWELSTARATYVLSYIASHYDLAAPRLSLAGYGQYHPVASNDTAEGRASNRRVDLVILSDESEKQEPPLFNPQGSETSKESKD
jgi:chemotaxis protein MotB